MKIRIIFSIEFECILNGLACLALFSIFCNFYETLLQLVTQKILQILQKLSVNLYFFYKYMPTSFLLFIFFYRHISIYSSKDSNSRSNG